MPGRVYKGEQAVWLREQIPMYRAAQAANQTKPFWETFYQEWRAKYPHPAPTPEEVADADGDAEAATMKKNQAIELRITQWMYNHARRDNHAEIDDGKTTKSTRGVIKLGQKKKMLQAWQAYRQLTYESKWKDICEKQYTTHERQWKADNPGVKPDTARLKFAFINKFMKEKWDAETDEDIKKHVEAYRRKIKLEADTQENELANMQKQENIDRLAKTMIEFCDRIHLATGWHIAFVAGGPEPKDGGSITTYVHHIGKTADGQDFAAWAGPSYNTWLSTFDNFVYSSFPEDVRAKWKLEKVRSSGGSRRRSDTSAEKDDVRSGEEDKEIENEEDESGEESGEEVEEEASAYAKERQANIAKINLILQQRGLLPEKKEKKPRVPRQKTKEVDTTQEVRRSSRLTSSSGSSSAHESSNANAPPDAGEVDKEVTTVPTSPKPNTEEYSSKLIPSTSESNGSIPSPAAPLDSFNGVTPAELNSGTRDLLPGNDNSITLPKPSSKGTTPAPDSATAHTLESEMIDSSNANGDNDGYEKDGHGGGNGDNAMDEDEKRDVMDARLSDGDAGKEVEGEGETGIEMEMEMEMEMGSKEEGNQGNVDKETDVGMRTGVDGMENDRNAINKGAAKLGNSHSHTVPQTDLTPLNDDAFDRCPDWLQPTLAYLRETSDSLAWQHLLADLIRFESSNPAPPHKQLGTQSRPNEVQVWIKRKKPFKSTPVSVDPNTYATQFNSWWFGLQPSWRSAKSAKKVEDVLRINTKLDREHWNSVLKGGNNGLYVVVMALSWWLRSDPASVDVWPVVDDVRWVIQRVTRVLESEFAVESTSSSKSGKRRATDDNEAAGSSRNKKARKAS
ncbi:hypothetical protein CVT24_009373 [Panaeolus cyanescens]|uniref:Uncharacterized protein n=1 Tax=Panaeolus cyanescens TaxID=181874 RepID=A0A409WEN2_9AGAR|nr:hypothetical protein CVT24_009373 [Panaeolus cyanescens]